MHLSIASPPTRPSPKFRRVGIRIITFEACSGFTRVTAHWIAQPPKAAFVTRLRPGQLPDRTARQLPDQSTTIWVEPSSTGDTRLRGARRVEERARWLGPFGIAPFPFPAHQTGRADFPHPAFRLASSQGPRRRARARVEDTAQPVLRRHCRREKRSVPRPCTLCRLRRKSAHGHRRVVDRPIGRGKGAIAEVGRPAAQKPVQSCPHLGPRALVARHQQVADLRLDPQHALLGRACAQIPVAAFR